ncbi:hypothetical protein SIN_0421 [Streptococcus infantis SK1302]|uniref:NADH dehydrogenase subunit 4L n=1 Tax=Streptococcus infantis SK1302 TaxID=871237 RepID=A0ABP2JCP3_9STRE|nr:hypothetical protein SIN_0421 [Streptococcus infantis SK1302]
MLILFEKWSMIVKFILILHFFIVLEGLVLTLFLNIVK